MITLHGNTRVQNFGDCLLVDKFDNLAKNKKSKFFWFSTPKHHNIDETLIKIKFRRSSKFVFIGGGYFTAPNEHSVKWEFRNIIFYIIPIIIYRLINKNIKFAAFGVGVGNLPRFYSFLLRSTLPRSTVFYVRDRESLPYAQRYSDNVQLGADAMISDCSQEKVALSRQKVVVHLSRKYYRGVDILSNVLKALDAYDDVEIVFITDTKGAKPNQQDEILEICRQKIPEANFIPYQNHNELNELLSSASVIVTTKLHVGIIGVNYGSCVVSIPCHPKIERYFRDIKYSKNCYEFQEELEPWLRERLSVTEKPTVPTSVLERTQKMLSAFEKFIEC